MRKQTAGGETIKTYYIDTGDIIYVFPIDPGLINKEKIARESGKRVLVLDRESFREMKMLLLPDTLKTGIIRGEAELIA